MKNPKSLKKEEKTPKYYHKKALRFMLAILNHEVQFSFGNQYFTLEYGGTKAEATWMARMLKNCFKNYELSLKP